MRNRILPWLIFGMIAVGLALSAAAFGQASTAATQPPVAAQPAPAGMAFEVASVRQSQAPDMQKMIADLQAGKKPESSHIDGSRAVFSYMSLKQLVAYAYTARIYEITGPDWMVTDRFDIAATLPAGATKDNVPAMMQALLKERFGLVFHRATVDDQPVLALIPGKSGPKLKAAASKLQPLDLSQPLAPGQSIVEAPDGPILLTRNPDGSSTYDMGARGVFHLKFDPSTRSMHMQADAITMNGVAVMINVLGGGQGREVVNQTQLPGAYQVSVEFSLMDLLGSLHDQGIDLPTGVAPSGDATDPEGGATLAASLDRLGLRLEKTRASVPRFVIDSIQKSPTAN